MDPVLELEDRVPVLELEGRDPVLELEGRVLVLELNSKLFNLPAPSWKAGSLSLNCTVSAVQAPCTYL